MISPLDGGPWLFRDEVSSTQDVAGEFLMSGGPEIPGAVVAGHQTSGRGRFGRKWSSQRGESLTMSLVFRAYSRHPAPWLIGMAVAVAVASAIDGQVQWPNDVVLSGKKVGGILTELLPSTKNGKVPVVGVGLNINQEQVPPELDGKATSLLIETGRKHDVKAVARSIVGRISDLPEPDSWESIEPLWAVFDATPGTSYQLATGESADAICVGSEGQLICLVNGIERSVLAADGIFGRPADEG
ncbi:MAG: biotin--[acetyl-CoA-carboxylase] ligase [Armatimonadetes bacterium]|nr:biotin--[acetyl-CoA-carboxylase] ligase [Armatimonadota bacterium]